MKIHREGSRGGGVISLNDYIPVRMKRKIVIDTNNTNKNSFKLNFVGFEKLFTPRLLSPVSDVTVQKGPTNICVLPFCERATGLLL